MANANYAEEYRNIDFRQHPELYKIGRGEQGVLIVEPYKSEILPHWRFATEALAKESAAHIYDMFLEYGRIEDFVGMDMARKFLQMGFTRARRYANHGSGRKYEADGTIRTQEADWSTSEKARAAAIFYEHYSRAKEDSHYLELKRLHLERQK